MRDQKTLAVRRWTRALAALSVMALAACVGEVGGQGGTPGPGGKGEEVIQTGDDIRLPRLSHLQWARTAQAFLKLPDTPALSFRPDTVAKEAFPTDVQARSMDSTLVLDYRAAADKLTDALLSDSTAYSRFVSDAGTGDFSTKLKTLIKTSWPRAFRHMLSDAEVEKYTAFGMGAPDVATAGDDDAKMKAALSALVRYTLQSTQFIYRMEFGDEKAQAIQGKSRVRPLTPAEYVTKLSYTLLNAPPDVALLAAAEQQAGTDEARAKLVDTMLADPRATDSIMDFLVSLYLVDLAGSMTKDPATFPGMEGLGKDAATEATKFLSTMLAKNVGLKEQLLSRTAFVNKRLAGIYGLDASGLNDNDFVEKTLPDERAGILTRVSWTGTKASLVERSSILRGVYATKKLLCTPIGVNPSLGNAVLPVPPETAVTNRDRVSFITGGGDCRACHMTTINPLGFAFENFNAIGQYVTKDHGQDVVSAGTVSMDGTPVNFTSARTFLEAAANAQQTHNCYVGNIASWMYGRALTDYDRSSIAATGVKSKAENASTRALLKDILTNAVFRSVVWEGT